MIRYLLIEFLALDLDLVFLKSFVHNQVYICVLLFSTTFSGPGFTFFYCPPFVYPLIGNILHPATFHITIDIDVHTFREYISRINRFNYFIETFLFFLGIVVICVISCYEDSLSVPIFFFDLYYG